MPGDASGRMPGRISKSMVPGRPLPGVVIVVSALLPVLEGRLNADKGSADVGVELVATDDSRLVSAVDVFEGLGVNNDPIPASVLDVLDLVEGDSFESRREPVRRRMPLGIERGGSLLKRPRLSSSPLRRWKLLPLPKVSDKGQLPCGDFLTSLS